MQNSQVRLVQVDPEADLSLKAKSDSAGAAVYLYFCFKVTL